jgi:hypothetical protein
MKSIKLQLELSLSCKNMQILKAELHKIEGPGVKKQSEEDDIQEINFKYPSPEE